MKTDFFPIAKDTPENLMVIKDQPSNINKHIYELSLSLFDMCNLRCSFCFQNSERECKITDFDEDYILNIPDRTIPFVKEHILRFQSKILYIRIWGGEIFNDKYGEQQFYTYSRMCQKFVDGLSNDIEVVFNFMTNGIWRKNSKLIVDLARRFNGTVGFSYDPVGRYSNEEQRTLTIRNIDYIFNELKYVNVAITATKPNIESILNLEDSFFRNMSPNVAVEINSYIPNKDWEINLPSEDMLYEFYRHMVDNRMFMVNIITQYVMSLFRLSPNRQSVCDCKASVQYSSGTFVSDCVEKSSCFHVERFYGEFAKYRTIENCHDIKMNMALQKRNCLQCKYFNICPGFCTASILFDKYEKGVCPIMRLMNYMMQNSDSVLKNFNEYRQQNKLPHEMLQ